MFQLLAQSDVDMVYTTDSTSSGSGIAILIAVAIVWIVGGLLTWVPLKKVGAEPWWGFVPVVGFLVATYRIFQRTRPEQAVLLTILSVFCNLIFWFALFEGFTYKGAAATN